MEKQLDLYKEYFGESEEELRAKKEREKNLLSEEDLKDLRHRIVNLNEDLDVDDFAPLMAEMESYGKRRMRISEAMNKSESLSERNRLYGLLMDPASNETKEYQEIGAIYIRYKLVLGARRAFLSKKKDFDLQQNNNKWYLHKKRKE